MANRTTQSSTPATDAPRRKRKYDARRETWGAIRKLKSGRLQASFVGPDSERHTAPQTFDTLEDARGWLAEQRRAIQRGEWKSPEQVELERAEAEKLAHAETFGRYAATWIEQRVTSKGRPLRPKTATEYRRQLEKGLAPFAGDRIPAITPARVRAWHADRMKAGATAAGAEARLLRAVLNTAVVDGIIGTCPVPGSLTRSATGIEHRPPTIEELSVMLDTIEPRFRLAILLAAYGNVRLSEWRALRRRDVTIQAVQSEPDDEGNVTTTRRVLIDVHRQAQYVQAHGWVVGPPKSEEGVRIVPLPAALTTDVEAHLAGHVGAFPDSLLFAPVGRSDFLHDRQWADRWNVARDAAGVRVVTERDEKGRPTAWGAVVREHDLRAFALTAFSVAGGTLRETQKFGGHGTADAAMRYQHAAADRLAAIVDRMPLPAAGSPQTPIRAIGGQ